MKVFKIPTGALFVDEYSKGELETLSIGDYGKAKNIKADFLGFNKEINGVPNGECIPLSEKWVVTLSTQYGCSQKCIFCDVPKIKFRGNATVDDLKNQLISALRLFPNEKYTDRLNIHFARMGEPILNENVFRFSYWLQQHKKEFQDQTGVRIETMHPVMTTSLPRYKLLESRLREWCDIKNYEYNGQAGLQLSINSCNDYEREKMFAGGSITLKEIAKICDNLEEPTGRKYCLNFAYNSGAEIDGRILALYFDPDKFMCKITPIHNNNSCRANKIETVGGYSSYAPYKEIEESLKDAGFDVLVFIPSMDEEKGLVTCGNAVLSGSQIEGTCE